ncbi:branched-chain amino acid ABC transporter permease [Starkeya sp. ORNL1]|uniref:branched-chain amino acid ABC transporter permease n=1 Tax=Starkeya sp. ORNL1 TaxID=2709380 RepID=UPI001464267C|nr:branched-chain amino acid ABC transporter permease [Starkeya sp. ORNL1]QJP12682.1 branched-chain amino acid ABC transporter permease [Starkeya sp. ORNL1]
MRLLAALAFLLLLAGCSSVLDADQARICRAIAPALYDEDATIRETSLAPLPEDADTLRLGYTVREDDVTRPHWLTCSFAGRSGVDRFDLVAVDTDAGPLSDIKLFFLKRWWLADATPFIERAPAFALSMRAAYWLQQALNGLTLAGIYGLIATSFALVYGLIGRINLAFGEIAVTGGVNMLVASGVVMSFGRLTGPGLAAALLAGVAAAALLSWVVGRVVVLPLTRRSRSPQPVLIGTIALAIVLTELLRITYGMRENWLPPLLNIPVPLAGGEGFIATVTPAQLLAAGLGMTGASILLGLLAFTSYGRSWRAYADDPLMACLLGVNAPRLLASTFVLSGAAAGLAGTVAVVAYGTIEPGAGISIGLKALISAVIGGIGSIPGAFIGAIVVAGVETLWSSAINIVYRDVAIYSLLVAFLVLRPGGLLNRAAPTPREF